MDRMGRNALMNAVIDRDYEDVKRLVKSGIDLNEKDLDSFTALHFAVQNNDYEIVKLLIDNGADVNIQDKYGNIPLNRAIKSYIDRNIIKILLDSGSNIDLENNSGISVRKLVETVVNFEYKDLF